MSDSAATADPSRHRGPTGLAEHACAPEAGAPDTWQVGLVLPADPAQLPLARTVAVSVGATAALTVDRIDDLRQCVQEALSLLLVSDGSGDLRLCYQATRGCVHVTALRAWHGDPTGPAPVDEFSFAWLMLGELATELSAQLIDGALRVSFVIEASR